MNTPVRVGLLGASKIARGAVIAPARDNPAFVMVAVAARDSERAKGYAEANGISEVAPDYASLVGRDDIDLVYNALPPAGHARWTIAALEAGKAVLCEKPFAMNASEARAMVEASRASGRPLIEAFHYRFHPVMRAAIALVREGALGRLLTAEAMFEGPIARSPGELRWTADQGGGAQMDLGCYPIHALRSLIGGEPQVTAAEGRFEHGVDASMRATLAFPDGVTGSVSCSMVSPTFAARLEVTGERGSLEIVNFLAPHLGATFVTRIDGQMREHATNGPTTYAAQLAHIAEVLGGKTTPLTGGDDAIGNMTVIDEIYRAAGRT